MDKSLRQNRETAVNQELDSFLAQIGGRVRKARAKRGVTRRTLAFDSGVSERYLAKLETGTANPSAAILRQIAHALDYPIGDFIPGAETMPAELSAVVEQLRTIDIARMADVKAILDTNFDTGTTRARRIALIGLRGAGKTSLGRRLSNDLDVPFVELNRLIEADCGAKIGELLALAGQSAFRHHERRCLEQTIATHEYAVIATGGGIVTEPGTFATLLRSCHCIWLQATPEEHMSRVVSQGDMRPMLKNREAMADLKSILKARTPFYERAAITFDTSSLDEDAAARGLLAVVKRLLS